MDELKACQKCGSDEVRTRHDIDNTPRLETDTWVVKCYGCGITTRWFDTEQQAINNWNTRAVDPRLKEALKRMRTLGVRSSEFIYILKECIPELMKAEFPELKEAEED